MTINSDDPACFGGYSRRLRAAAEALDLTREDLATCARNSLEASFAPEPQRMAWLADLDAHLRA